MSNRDEKTYDVGFTVGEHPDTEYETVTVEDGVVDGAGPEERAIVAAAEQSPYSHVETVTIHEQDTGGD